MSKAVGENVSKYAVKFHKRNLNYIEDQLFYNVTFLRLQQDFLNELLKMRGHVFLNEAYDAIGVKRTSSGAIVGWRDTQVRDDLPYYPQSPDSGDNQIVFHIIQEDNYLVVDFNVEGIIYNKI